MKYRTVDEVSFVKEETMEKVVKRMKELEALERIRKGLASGYSMLFSDDYKLIEQAITPPTEEEVCKALSEYLQWDVIYDEINREFKMKIDNTSIVKVNQFGSVKFNAPLNVRLITLIGRFYQGEVE